MTTYKSNTQDFRVVTNGTDGNDGVGISSIIPQYYLSTSEDECIGGSWSTEQSWADGYYLWTRSLITWDNGNVSTTEAIVAGAINSANETANEVKGELSLKVGVNDNEQIVSMINASANEICITGDRLVIESTNFTLTAEGKVKCVDGEFSGNITGGSINIGDNFSVNEKGNATLKNGTFTGTVQADMGYFGAFVINDYGIYTEEPFTDANGRAYQMRYQISAGTSNYMPGIWFEAQDVTAHIATARMDDEANTDFDCLQLYAGDDNGTTSVDIYGDRVEISSSLEVGDGGLYVSGASTFGNYLVLSNGISGAVRIKTIAGSIVNTLWRSSENNIVNLGSAAYGTQINGSAITLNGDTTVSGSLTVGDFTIPEIQHGNVSVTADASSSTTISVSFDQAFSYAPDVTLSIKCPSTGISVRLGNVFTTSFTAYVTNESSVSLTPTLYWAAYYG